MPLIHVHPPAEIDGSPAEVAKGILADLTELTDDVAEYVDDAVKQLANATRTLILAQDPGASAETLARVYEGSAQAANQRALTDAAKAFCAAVAGLS